MFFDHYGFLRLFEHRFHNKFIFYFYPFSSRYTSSSAPPTYSMLLWGSKIRGNKKHFIHVFSSTPIYFIFFANFAKSGSLSFIHSFNTVKLNYVFKVNIRSDIAWTQNLHDHNKTFDYILSCFSHFANHYFLSASTTILYSLTLVQGKLTNPLSIRSYPIKYNFKIEWYPTSSS